MKNRIFAFLILAFVQAVFFMGCEKKDEMSFSVNDMSETAGEKSADADFDSVDVVYSQDVLAEASEACREIYVDVCGAVENPGVYSLKEDARVFEAIEAAGGFAEDASPESVNQAEKVTDAQRIYIMNRGEWEEAKAGGTLTASLYSVQETVGKVNINTASESELCTLPGIGSTRAAAIIAYRESCGGFSSIEEIQKVSGIKSGTYEKICGLIKVK